MMAAAEVLVAGGGLAGCAAAIESARLGARTLLVERESSLGGEAAGGLVGGSENQFYDASLRKMVSGMAAEVIEEIYSAQFGRPLDWGAHASTYWFCHEPEVVKQTMLLMCEYAGVTMLLDSTITDVLVEGSRVKGVVAHSLNGFSRLACRVAVDATGDGTLAALAGVPWTPLHCPSSFLFRMGSVALEDTRRHLLRNPTEIWNGAADEVERELASFEHNWSQGCFCLIDRSGSTLGRSVSRAVEHGDYSLQRHGYDRLDRLGMEGLRDTGSVQVNTGMIRVDSFDPKALTAAEAGGRRLVPYVSEFLRKYVPGFQSALVVATATRLGRRFSRRVETVGEQKAEDLEARSTDAIGRYFTSPHRPEEKRRVRYIPYSCMLPKTIEGLVMASGKSFNTTIDRRQPHRSIGSTLLIGELAGAAAALATRRNVDLKRLDPAEIRQNCGSLEDLEE